MFKHKLISLVIALSCIAIIIVVFAVGIHFGMVISPKQYEQNILPILNVFGTWFGALATFFAVLVSLWLAFWQINQNKEMLDCTISVKMLVSNIYSDICIALDIVSKGNKPANVQSIGWHGKGASEYRWVIDFHPESTRLPKRLSYGERVSILLTPGSEKYLKKYIAEQLNGRGEKLYFVVSTTTESRKIKATREILDFINES